jgi:hypothetical protein
MLQATILVDRGKRNFKVKVDVQQKDVANGTGARKFYYGQQQRTRTYKKNKKNRSEYKRGKEPREGN